MMTTEVDNWQDMIDVRDIIARFEELSEDTDNLDDEEFQERDTLWAILEELKGNGGDEQWKGDWYPVTLIRDSHFEDYAKDLAEDIGAVNDDAGWPNCYIDWERATASLQMDYSTVDYNGTTYWYR